MLSTKKQPTKFQKFFLSQIPTSIVNNNVRIDVLTLAKHIFLIILEFFVFSKWIKKKKNWHVDFGSDKKSSKKWPRTIVSMEEFGYVIWIFLKCVCLWGEGVMGK